MKQAGERGLTGEQAEQVGGGGAVLGARAAGEGQGDVQQGAQPRRVLKATHSQPTRRVITSRQKAITIYQRFCFKVA